MSDSFEKKIYSMAQKQDFERLHVNLDNHGFKLLSSFSKIDSKDTQTFSKLQSEAKKIIDLRNKYKSSLWYA